MKKLKPEPSQDDLTELLRCAAIWGRKATLEYLLQIGANPNDKANGGSSALDTALRDLSFVRFDAYNWKRLKSKYDVSRSLDCVQVLLAHGAIWNPEERYELNSLRRALLACEPDVTIELLRLFRKHTACPAARVHRLLGTPRMRDHLKSEIDALRRLGIHLDVGWSQSSGKHSRA